MKDGRLSKMTLKQLRELQETIAAAIAAREAEERSELKNKLAELASKAGYSVGELFGARGRKRGPATVKYRHPDDASLTWTGRGRKPRWMVKAGGDIERFRTN